MRKMVSIVVEDGKYKKTYWFKHPDDGELFMALIEQLWTNEFEQRQQLSDSEFNELIASL